MLLYVAMFRSHDIIGPHCRILQLRKEVDYNRPPLGRAYFLPKDRIPDRKVASLLPPTRNTEQPATPPWGPSAYMPYSSPTVPQPSQSPMGYFQHPFAFSPTHYTLPPWGYPPNVNDMNQLPSFAPVRPQGPPLVSGPNSGSLSAFPAQQNL